MVTPNFLLSIFFIISFISVTNGNKHRTSNKIDNIIEFDSGKEIISRPIFEKDSVSTSTLLNVRNEHLSNEYVITLEESADPKKIAREYGIKFVSCFKETKMCLFSQPGSSKEEHPGVSKMRRDAQVKSIERQVVRKYAKHYDYEVNLNSKSWHLVNQLNSQDVNILSAWEKYSGRGINIGIVDDSLQHTHPDLKENYRADTSYDFNGNDKDPSPVKSSDVHGTSVAGVAAAVSNTICGLGAAYHANISGIRLISDGVSDWQVAQALTYSNEIDIYSNSWGFADTLSVPLTQTLATAFTTGVKNGRDGKGFIYTWAAGNSRTDYGNANYDSLANAPESIAVAAVSYLGSYSSYSNPGSALFVSAPSSGAGIGIYTTDRVGSLGYDSGDCTTSFGGTSSATPLVSGCIALMLEANPNLGWRDVQHILAHSSRKNDPSNSDWRTNGAGFHVNHNYGFGTIDASTAVELATSWNNVPERVSIQRDAEFPGSKPIQNTGEPLVITWDITDSLSVEHVQVSVSLQHKAIRTLTMELISPSGTSSRLLEKNSPVTSTSFSWTFMSVFNWGEDSKGTWTLKIVDTSPQDSGTGNLLSADLTVWGHYAKVDLVADVFNYCSSDTKYVTFTWNLPLATYLRVTSENGAYFSYYVNGLTSYTAYYLQSGLWTASLSDSDQIHAQINFSLPDCSQSYLIVEVVSCDTIHLNYKVNSESPSVLISLVEQETLETIVVNDQAPLQGFTSVGRPFYGVWKAIIEELESEQFSGVLCQIPSISVSSDEQCETNNITVRAENALLGMEIVITHISSGESEVYPCSGENPFEFTIPKPEQDGFWEALIQLNNETVFDQTQFTVSSCKDPIVTLGNQTQDEMCENGVTIYWDNAPEGSWVGLRLKYSPTIFQNQWTFTQSTSGKATFPVNFDGNWAGIMASHENYLLTSTEYISIKCTRGPSAPRNYKVSSISKTKVSLDWSKPSDDGGSPIVHYNLRISLNQVKWYDFEILWYTSARFSGLTPGTTYYTQIRAGNINSYGDWTDILTFTTNS